MEKKTYYFKIIPYVYTNTPLIFKVKEKTITLASYKKEYKNKIPIDISKELDKWANLYVDHFDRPLQDVSIIYFENNICHENSFTEEEIKITDWIVNSICFVFSGMPMDPFKNANNLQSEYISVTIPSEDNNSFSIRAGRKHIAGPKFDKDRIRASFYITPQKLVLNNYEKEILDALMVVINKSEDESDEYKRILRAIEWFNHANHEEMYEQPENQIISMSVAFESLINTPREKITEYFKNTISQLVLPSKEIMRWAGEFYDIRSALVHGGKIKINELLYGKGHRKHVSHYYLSKLIFIDVLLTKLQVLGLIQESYFSKYLRVSRIEEYLLSNNERFSLINQFDLTETMKDINKCDLNSATFKLLRTINAEEEIVSVDIRTCDNTLKKLNEINGEIDKNNINGVFKSVTTEAIEKVNEIKMKMRDIC